MDDEGPSYKVMDYVRIRKSERVVKSAVMYNQWKKRFYVNPMWGGNIYLDDCDEIEMIREWKG